MLLEANGISSSTEIETFIYHRMEGNIECDDCVSLCEIVGAAQEIYG